jgi:hypothetical protein
MIMRRLPTAAVVAVATLILTACGASMHQASRPSAAQCGRWEALVRPNAVMASPFTGVTSARGVAAAERKLGQLSRDLATGATSRSSVVPIPKTPPLSRELRLETADFMAFLTANSHGGARPAGGRRRRAEGNAGHPRHQGDLREAVTASSEQGHRPQ